MTTLRLTHTLTLAAALCGLAFLAACVTDEQAVDLGLATACDGTTTYGRLGDPAGRYLVAPRSEVCKGAKRGAGTRQQTIVVDCSAGVELTATVAQSMANPRRNGPDFDLRAAAEAQVTRLKVGLTDFAGLQAGLTAAGVPFTVGPGRSAEQCVALKAGFKA